MDKSQLIAELDQTVENFQKDMALFEEDSQHPATVSDLSRLSTMTFYAISNIAKIIKKL